MKEIKAYREKLKHTKFYEHLINMLFFIAGTALYAASVSVFTSPNKIAPGGVTGIATIMHYVIGTPIGTMIFILNIPLLILGLKYIGGPFIIRTFICTALASFFVDLYTMIGVPAYTNNLLLAALYGGIISGAGLALVFLRGSTTGGSDIASRLLKLKYRHISMGRMMFTIDTAVILLSAAAFRSVDSALYAMVSIFASSRVIDAVLYGSDFGKMAVIISNKNTEIAKTVNMEMHRGITILNGKGFYTGAERDVVICAIRRPEAARLRSIVMKVDPSAFIIVCDASEVIGEGFKPITKEI